MLFVYIKLKYLISVMWTRDLVTFKMIFTKRVYLLTCTKCTFILFYSINRHIIEEATNARRKPLPLERTHIYIIQSHKMRRYIKIYRGAFKFTEIKYHMGEVVSEPKCQSLNKCRAIHINAMFL